MAKTLDGTNTEAWGWIGDCRLLTARQLFLFTSSLCWVIQRCIWASRPIAVNRHVMRANGLCSVSQHHMGGKRDQEPSTPLNISEYHMEGKRNREPAMSTPLNFRCHHPEVNWTRFHLCCIRKFYLLTLPMLRLHSSNAQGCKKYWKLSKPCPCWWYSEENFSWVLSDEYQYARVSVIFRVLISFCIGQISHQ